MELNVNEMSGNFDGSCVLKAQYYCGVYCPLTRKHFPTLSFKDMKQSRKPSSCTFPGSQSLYRLSVLWLSHHLGWLLSFD